MAYIKQIKSTDNVTYDMASFWLYPKSTLTLGASGLQYFNQTVGATTGATKNANPVANQWFHIIRMNHADRAGYYTDLAFDFHANDIYIRTINNGTEIAWDKIAKINDIPSIGNGTVTITQNGKTKGTFTMNQSGNTTIALTDTDKDTHYTAKLVTGNSKTNTNNNGSLTNGNVFLNLIENNTVRSSHKITGSGATAVTTDTDGNIVINTPQLSNASALNIVSGNEIRFNLNGGMSGTDELYINYKFADGTQASKIKTYKFLTGNGDEVANVKAYLDWSYLKNCPVKSGKAVDNTIKNTFRTQLKGDSDSGTFITAFRNDSDSSLTDFPVYSSGLSWGVSNTNSYLMARYSTPEAWIGAGSDNKITWTRQLAFVNDLAKYLPLSGGTITGQLKVNNYLVMGSNHQLKWGDYTSAQYIMYHSDNSTFEFRNASGVLVCTTVSASIQGPNASVTADSSGVSIKGKILTSLPLTNAHYIRGTNKAGTKTEDICGIGSNDSCYLGSSSFVTRLRGSSIYMRDTSTAVTSDKNLKKDIILFDERYDKFFDLLRPVGFKYIFGTSNRTHSGFIAQEVEEALAAAKLTGKDFAIIDKASITEREISEIEVENEDGVTETKMIDTPNSDVNYLLDKGITEEYHLRYDEMVGLLVDQVQKLKRRVDELESKIKE